MSTSKRHTVVGLAKYKALEGRITKGKLDALLGRWNCGRHLLKERGANGRLPRGRLEALANTLARSAAELKNRMQFAEQYPTEAKVRAAFTEHGSWFAICKSGLGARRDQSTSQDIAHDSDAEAEPDTNDDAAGPKPPLTVKEFDIGTKRFVELVERTIQYAHDDPRAFRRVKSMIEQRHQQITEAMERLEQALTATHAQAA